MPIVEWNDSYLVGIEDIDQHHRHLVQLLNDTYDAFTDGSHQEKLGGVLDELIDYATYHFACEERWMQDSSYPGLSVHREEHERFIGRIVEIQKDFHARRANLTLEVLSFLKNWLTSHILQNDAGYGRFVAAARERRTGAEIKLI